MDESGAAIYTIPLATPPGVNGVEPALSLRYSSNASNGLLGVGWSLDGLSVITRGASSKDVYGVNDAISDPVDFASDDRFFADGKRLIAVGGVYGAAESEYRTEQETFSRFVAKGGEGYGPAWFEVWTKNGLRMEYGNTADSKHGTVAASYWLLNRVEDRNGNYWLVEYENHPGTITPRVREIRYTGNGTVEPTNTVRFLYEARPDPIVQQIAGQQVLVNERLRSVEYVHAPEGVPAVTVRAYELAYDAPAYTNRSRLRSVQEIGLDEKRLPPTTFAWSEGAHDYEQTGSGSLMASGGTPSRFTGVYPADFNGDGLTDFLEIADYRGPSINSVFRSARIHVSNGSGYTLANTLSLNSGSTQEVNAVLVGDFDGDGLSDFVVSYNAVRTTGSTVGSYSSRVYSAVRNSVTGDLSFTDHAGMGGSFTWIFIGNGQYRLPFAFVTVDYARTTGAHLMVINNGAPGGVPSWSLLRFARTPTSGSWQTSFSGNSNQLSVDNQFLPLDINGDGVTELLTRAGGAWDPSSSAYGIFTNAKGGYGFLGGGWLQNVFDFRMPLTPADFNGDGVSDLLVFTPYVYSSNGNLYYFNDATYFSVGTGTGFYTGPQLTLDSGAEGWDWAKFRRIAVADFNEDGKDDLWITHRSDDVSGYGPSNPAPAFSGSRLWLADTASSGGLSFRSATINAPGVEPGTNDQVIAVNLNGDGKRDLLVLNRSTNPGTWRILRATPPATSVKADLVTSVTNGLGATDSITYATLADTTVYTRGANLDGLVNQPGPAIVVKTLTRDLGPAWNGTTYSQANYTETYRYEGLRTATNRGLAGFAAHEVTDSRTGLTTRVERRQDHPFTGFVTRVTVKRGAVVLSDTVNTPNVRHLQWGTGTNRTFFTFASPSVTTTADLPTDANSPDKLATAASGVLSTVTTTQTHDDYGNPLVTTLNHGHGGRVTTRTRSYYPADLSAWLISRPETETTVVAATGQKTITRTVAYTYKSIGNRLRLDTLTTDAADPAVRLVTSFTAYDAFGNLETTVTTGRRDAANDQTRTQTTLWDERGRFPRLVRNALNHEQILGFDPVLGVLQTHTDANQLTTTFAHDAFGRPVSATLPDLSVSSQTLRWRAAPVDGFALETRHASADGTRHSGPPALALYDRLSRPERSATLNADGVVVWQQTRHDPRGLPFRASLPYTDGTSPALWSTALHDGVGRPWRALAPNGVQTDTTYAGLTIDQLTTATHDNLTLERHSRVTTDPLGRVISAVQNPLLPASHPEHSAVAHTYDALGQLAVTTNPGGSQIILDTEATRGVRTQISDPNTGTWTYKINAFGETYEQTDAKLQVTRFAYDVLGRLLTRTEAATGPSPLLTTWTYDTAPGKGVGSLATVTAADGAGGNTTETYAYDLLGRPLRVTQTIAGTEYFSEITGYDSVGAPVASRLGVGPHVTPVVVFNYTTHYNAHGFLREIRSPVLTNGPPVRLWSLQEVNTYNQPTRDLLGSGLARARAYDPADGGLRELRTGRSDGRAQAWSYTPDPLGNLRQRAELHPATSAILQSETFAYDSLDRLTTGAAYDQTGNITQRDGNAYVYTGPRPHAVTQAGSTTYQYDANGQLLGRDGVVEINYAPFNHPLAIARNGSVAAFRYGADRQRVEQIIDGRTIRYAGPQIEQVIPPPPAEGQPAAPVETKFTLFAGGGRLVQITFRAGEAEPAFLYLAGDTLGSVEAITDGLGQRPERLSHDAWGRRRSAEDWSQPAPARVTNVTRGYTDHEELETLGLVHMNGRLYDPALARFLGPDPVVQLPHHGQNRNRYSYVLNNPLKYTDPSGYQFVYGGSGGYSGGLTSSMVNTGGGGSWDTNFSFGGFGGGGGGFGTATAFNRRFGAGTATLIAQNAQGQAIGSSGFEEGTVLVNHLYGGRGGFVLIDLGSGTGLIAPASWVSSVLENQAYLDAGVLSEKDYAFINNRINGTERVYPLIDSSRDPVTATNISLAVAPAGFAANVLGRLGLTSLGLGMAANGDISGLLLATPGGRVAAAKTIPQKATDVLQHVRQTGKPPPGFVGGRTFKNAEGQLPAGGRYREYDVDVKPPHGTRRNAERIVVDENTGKAWYSDDHYGSFTEIK